MLGTVRKEKSIDGHKFYPTHINNEELQSIISEFLTHEGTKEISEVLIRKSHGGKGIDFKINNYYLSDDNQQKEDRRYTFSIDPNWEINDFFDHWHPGTSIYEKWPSTKVACERLLQFELESIKDIVEKRLKNADKAIIRNSLLEMIVGNW